MQFSMHALLSTGYVRAIQQFFMNLLNIKSHKNPFISSRVVAWKQTDRRTEGRRDFNSYELDGGRHDVLEIH